MTDHQQAPRGGSSGAKRSKRNAFSLILLVAALHVFGGVLWMRFTPQGRNLAARLLPTGATEAQVEAEQQSAEALRQAGLLVISEPPEKRVTSVNFRSQAIDDHLFARLQDLFRLQSLDLGDSNAADRHMDIVGRLTTLGCLVLNGTDVTDAGLAQLTGLSELEALHVKNVNVTNHGLVDVAQMTNLAILDLSNNSVTDAGLAHLAPLGRLQWLLLENTEVTDAGLEHLAKIPSLRRVTLLETQVTGAGVQRLKAAIPGVDIDR